MPNDSKQTGWVFPILFGFLAVVIAYVTSMIAVFGYAFSLAFRAKGAPDQALIRQFAIHWAPWITDIVCLGLTGLFAWRLAKRSGPRAPSSGVVLGLSAGLFILGSALLFGHPLGVRVLVVAAVLVILGWLGDRLGLSGQKDGSGI